MAAANLETSIHFLIHVKLYVFEKPYSLRYAREERITRTNIKLERRDDIIIKDIRGREQEYCLEKNGFAVSKLGYRYSYLKSERLTGLASIY